ncbi:MAG: DNA/RNA nuclease SfsA [Holosporaceae bacterium]|jgi:sugar fermentation stimulation protein A|nr:DNA/RNA nuclease SfsA [Holosporaceae bacterium]
MYLNPKNEKSFEIYPFNPFLEQALVISRQNRFLMQVEKDGSTFLCHCPSTGKIGNIIFDKIPCLLSKSADEKRKTLYTVEAISLDKAKSWIGINQNAVNRYVEHFFCRNALEEIVKNGPAILREQKIGNSKLDFKIENTYIEVKMPLQFLAFAEGERPCSTLCANSSERFVRHISELKNRLQNNENALMLVCFVYDAPIFTPPKRTEQNKIIGDAVRESMKAGVKMWQVNMAINPNGVELLKYFDITDHLFYD